MLKSASFLALLLFCVPLAAQTPPSENPKPEGVTAPEGMVYVPAGEFSMGTDDSDRSEANQRDNVPLNANDARPRHAVTLGAYFIDKTEVTNAQYKKFCDATNYPPPPHWKAGAFPESEANFPVRYVNWYEASAFARWAGKRLPTEAEWEKAARGTDGRAYPWGTEWRGDRSNSEGGSAGEVGKYAEGASPFGALDMAGNASEWTSSWFDGYPKSPTKQPDFGRKLKVVRGGAYFSGQSQAQTWYRAVNRPQSRLMWIGFRCVKDAP